MIDQALVMIQNADPTGETVSDPPELSTLEGCWRQYYTAITVNNNNNNNKPTIS